MKLVRFFDVFFSSFALIFFSPLFIIVIIFLRFTGEGEIFFFQDRVGQNGKIIKLIKFTTMLKNSENIGTGTVTVKNDPRVLPFGKFLRLSKINELPQLLNIFFGDISVIGPRPLTKETFNYYNEEAKKKILEVKPGLSGIGSIIFRAEEEIIQNNKNSLNTYEDIIAPYKGVLELWFVENKSIKNYFLLIFLTMFSVVSSKSNLHWQILTDLPEPPDNLKNLLNYPVK